MKRRALVTTLLLGLIILAMAVSRPRQPSYQGRPLQYWLTKFESSQPDEYVRSAEAIRHLGVQAIPFILSQLTNNPARVEPVFNQKLRSFFASRSFNPLPAPALSLRYQAMAALDALGPEAQNAIPVLENILQTGPPDTGPLIIFARIGKPAIPSLEHARTNQNQAISIGARLCLDLIRTNSSILSPPDPADDRFNSRLCALNNFILSETFREWAVRNNSSPKQVTNPFAPQSLAMPDGNSVGINLPAKP